MQTTKVVYIHIGTHKTGSTFLQKFLLWNREALLKRGVFLPLLQHAKKDEHTFPNKLNPNFVAIIDLSDFVRSNDAVRKTLMKGTKQVLQKEKQTLLTNETV